MQKRRGPSIEDVAREAGVSVATVSRALRGLPNVAVATRQRVEEVADRLQYRADPSAARLATGETKLVQIALPTVDGWFFSRFMAGAIEVLLDDGYEAIAHPVENPEEREQFLAELLQLEKRVDGLLIVDLNISEDAAVSLREAGINTVTAGFSTQSFPSIVVDDFQVGYLATAHLLDLGHTRIGLISGEPNHPLALSVPGLRLAGYSAALGERGIKVDPTLEQSGRFTAPGGRRAMEHLLALGEPPTAVFAMSDEMAFGAWRAVLDAGLEWPTDVAVVGVDDHELAEMVGLTTVRLAPRALGAAAASRLVQDLESNDRRSGPIESAVAAEVVSRMSTIGPASA
ncbi:MAG: LacI family DNA-binding transcriptional regulator [Acidimicrobiales bacterium]